MGNVQQYVYIEEGAEAVYEINKIKHSELVAEGTDIGWRTIIYPMQAASQSLIVIMWMGTQKTGRGEQNSGCG